MSDIRSAQPDPVQDLKSLLNDGHSIRIINYPQKYSPNIAIQYSKLTDIKRVLLAKGHDPRNIRNFITPEKDFHIRNHFECPAIDMDHWRLGLEGSFEREQELSMEDLKRFKKITRVTIIECTGNQRAERFQYGKQTTAFLRESTRNKLMRFLDPFQIPITVKLLLSIVRGFGLTGGNQFDNGEFTGVRLFDVLKQYPMKDDAVELVFEGMDSGYDMLAQRAAGKRIHYGRSFKIDELRAYDPILCFEMNGKPLSKDHGRPLRLIIPGMYGAEHVKWLGRIIAVNSKYDGYFQNEYYGYRINGEMVPVHEQRPKSLVVKVLRKGRKITIIGVAWRGRHPIEKVLVSIDGMNSWNSAVLLHKEIDHSWLFWKYEPPEELKGKVTIVPRAFCSNGDRQPLHPGRYSTVYGNNSVISAIVKL